MSELENKAREAREKLQMQNPSVAPGKGKEERKRIPLSVPQRILEVPAIPGYHLRWFRGTPSRLKQAENAGYSFVHESEVELNNVVLGGDATKAGNSDMGSRVSVIEGSETDSSGQAVRMYLMKQPMEYYLEDRKIIDDRNDSVADALTQGMQAGVPGGRVSGETEADAANRYVDRQRTKLPELFRRKVRQ